MEVLYTLKEMALKELEPLAHKRNLSGGEWDRVDDIVGIIKDIVTTCAMEDGGYSGDGDWEAHMTGNYGRGHSYTRRRDSRGRYSGDGNNRGGYSGDGDSIERMLAEAHTPRERELILRMAGRA